MFRTGLWTGLTAPGPVWPVRPGCRSSGRHNFLIRTPNWTFHICISIFSSTSMQWWGSIDHLTTLSWLFWPVYTTTLTGLSRLSSKPVVCQFCVSTYAPMFLGIACVPRNTSQSQNCTETMKDTCAPITSCLQWWRNPINHISWYGSRRWFHLAAHTPASPVRYETEYTPLRLWLFGIRSKVNLTLQMTMDAQINSITMNSNWSLQCLLESKLRAYNEYR